MTELGVKYELKGFDALKAELEALPDKLAKPAIRSGFFAARGIMVRAAKAAAPVYRGKVSQTRSYRRTVKNYGILRTEIKGELKGQGKGKRATATTASVAPGLFLPRVVVYAGSAFWGRLIETGWNLKRWRRNGAATFIKAIPARPWFYRAIDAQRSAINDRLAVELRKRIDRAKAKLGK